MLHAKYYFEIWLQIERLNYKVFPFNDWNADCGKAVLGWDKNGDRYAASLKLIINKSSSRKANQLTWDL